MNRSFTILILVLNTLLAVGQGTTARLAVQTGHSNEVSKLVFSTDSKLLASADKDGTVKIWFVPTGNEMGAFRYGGEITSMTFTADNKQLLLASASEIISIDIESMKETDRVSPVKNIRQIVTTADGLLVLGDALADINGTILLDSLPDVWAAARTAKGLLVMNKNDQLSNISIGESKKLRIPDAAYDGVASISGSGRIAAMGYYAKLEAYDLDNNQRLFAINSNYSDDEFQSVGISDKYGIMVGGNTDGIVYVADIERKKITERLKGHLAGVTTVAFSPDEEVFVTGSRDRSIMIWNSRTLRLVRKLTTRSFRIHSVAVAKNAQVIAFGDEYGSLKILDFDDLSFQVRNTQLSRYEVADVQFTPDNEKLIVGSNDNQIREVSFESMEIIDSRSFKRNKSLGYVKQKALDVAGFYSPSGADLDMIQVSDNGHYIYAYGDVPKAKWRMELAEVFDRSDKWKRNYTFSESELKSTGEFEDLFRMLASANVEGTTGIFGNYTSEKINLRHIKMKDGILYAYSENEEILGISGKEKLAMNIELDPEIPFSKAFDISYPLNTVVMSHENDLVLKNINTGDSWLMEGHTDKITDLAIFDNQPLLITSSLDATMKIWNLETRQLVVTLIPIDFDKVVLVSPDNYYLAPKGALDGLGFRQGSDFFPAEQFDLIYNRPDIVLSRLGFADKGTIEMFEKAYAKRLRKMNFQNVDFTDPELHLPEIEIETATIPLQTDQSQINLEVNALDNKYKLNRLNISVNNIPIYGMRGMDLSDENSSQFTNSVSINLSPGLNQVKVSAINEQGVESLASSFEINCTAEFPQPRLYTYTIGVSEYKQSDFNLQFAAKDARDVASLMQDAKNMTTNVIEITDVEAGKETILKIKEELLKSSVVDKVLIFVAGHGVLDENLDYYLATHDMDFMNPSARGLAYEELENVLDGIPARNKLLMIDACHSGEVDKEELEIVDRENVPSGDLVFRAVPGKQVKKVGLDNSFELMKTLFADLRKNSGAIVISSAGGAEYAIEGNRWNNGVFTYSFINGIRSGKADLNKDGVIRASELQKYLESEVTRLTNGKQKPTSRVENLLNDFIIW